MSRQTALLAAIEEIWEAPTDVKPMIQIKVNIARASISEFALIPRDGHQATSHTIETIEVERCEILSLENRVS